jgi:spermidine synthase
MSSTPSPAIRTALLAIFVLSGLAGLIYQSIWSHYLGLFVGHAAYAQALVLAIFMGGMALGAALVARAGERWRNLVRGYAVVEGVIGLAGLAFHGVFVFALDLSYDSVIPALAHPALIAGWKWGLAVTLILPQSILLGMTFPLMSGGIIRRWPGADGNVLGGLYFTNSIGAAAGALIATFLLMPRIGLDGAVFTAGLINIAVALLAWFLGAGRETPRPANLPKGEDEAPRARGLLYLVLGATALSGAASFVYEIAFVRMLSLAVGNTLHAFELMLAAFIAGIAFGGLWVRRRADRSANPLILVGWMQVLMGLAALISLALYANAFEWVGALMKALARSDAGYVAYNAGTAALAILIMIPSAFFAGTTLPLFTVALLRAGFGESAIGKVYAWNTLGAILGVVAAVHLLIPGLGLKLALVTAAFVDMLIGLTLLRRAVDSDRAMLRFASAGGMVVVGLVLAITQVQFDPLRLASGVYRTGEARLAPDVRVLFHRDGKTASVSVFVSPGGAVSIATNGKVDASIQTDPERRPQLDEPTMVLAGALPLAYHHEPRRGAVIGFGSGLTTHTLLADRRLERVDTIEIEQAMVDGARLFRERVERAYRDPRSRIVIDDAKSFFSGQNERYDLIVSEPSNPWITGVGALFSQEFYAFIPRHLSEDGVFVQWLQLYEIDDRLVGSILAALAPAFSDFAAYLANAADLLIVAKPNGSLGEPDFASLFETPVGAELRRAGIPTPEHAAFRKIADGEMVRALARLLGSRPNSDYFPILSLQAPRTRFLNIGANNLMQLAYPDADLRGTFALPPPLDPDLTLDPGSHFPGEEVTWVARRMVDRLFGETLPEDAPTRPQEAEAVALRALLGNCAGLDDPFVQQRVLAHLAFVGSFVIFQLPAEAAENAIAHPAWQGCEDLPARVAAAIDVLAALASRQDARILARGQAWLEAELDHPPQVRDLRLEQMVYVAMLLAHYRSGDFAALDSLEARFGPLVRADGHLGFLRSFMLAASDRSGTAER